MRQQRERLKKLVLERITRVEFLRHFTADDWRYWFGNGQRQQFPDPREFAALCELADISPTYVITGDGVETLSAIRELDDSRTRALDLAAANSRRLDEILELARTAGDNRLILQDIVERLDKFIDS